MVTTYSGILPLTIEVGCMNFRRSKIFSITIWTGFCWFLFWPILTYLPNSPFSLLVTPPGTDENGVDFWTAARRAAQLPRLFWLALYRIQVPSMRRRTRRIERFAKKPTRAFFLSTEADCKIMKYSPSLISFTQTTYSRWRHLRHQADSLYKGQFSLISWGPNVSKFLGIHCFKSLNLGFKRFVQLMNHVVTVCI